MTRLVTLAACALTVSALFVLAPLPAERPGVDRLARYRAHKGKIDPSKPHMVTVSPDFPLVVHLHSTNISPGDPIDLAKVKGKFPGYKLVCTSANAVADSTTSDTLLRFKFQVTRGPRPGGKNPEARPRDDYGTGDLTITLNTDEGPSESGKIPAVGE
ncbi:MAG: hypothetical protein U0835_23850 [Isosphaeraceae bacterium]